MVEDVTNKDFLSFKKLDLMYWNVIFLCLIHGPQNCMKWMKIAFRCWNLCFRIIVWCFNPVDTIHLFLWEKIVPFVCGKIARLWIPTTCFGVCLWQSLTICRDIFLILKGIEWRLKIRFLMTKYTHHTGKCIRRFAGIYAYCRYFIDRKWSILVLILYIKTCHLPKGL